ncbi:hypothetical protein [Microbacterium sp. PMB16]|uniref:hypothetical protein n=1 Tax=Microbacterium sp. PMB16 TaxID=3120157 RepID=UPI003F4BB06D
MPEIAQKTTSGLSRRTILQASAWSIPVMAVAVATPLAAASTAIDLELVARPGGDRIGGTNPEGTQAVDLTLPFTYDATSAGGPVSNATLVVSFDTRLIDGPSVTIDGFPAQQIATELSGTTRTVTFSLPFDIPGNGETIAIQPSFAIENRTAWVPDAADYVVTLLGPGGRLDLNPSNNTVTMAPQYGGPPV